MKKFLFVPFIILITFGLASFTIHKFYVSIYQIAQNIPKKRLEITCRIFIDDLNKVLSKQYTKKISICEPSETTEDINFLKQYLSENIVITVNGKTKPILFKSKELETNVVVCYLNCADVQKIKTFSIKNTALLSLNKEQQNIIQIKINKTKQSLLLTSADPLGVLKF